MLRGFQQQGLKRIRTDTKAVVENDTTAAPDARELSAKWRYACLWNQL
jgi:hypothetical protein